MVCSGLRPWCALDTDGLPPASLGTWRDMDLDVAQEGGTFVITHVENKQTNNDRPFHTIMGHQRGMQTYSQLVFFVFDNTP